MLSVNIIQSRVETKEKFKIISFSQRITDSISLW